MASMKKSFAYVLKSIKKDKTLQPKITDLTNKTYVISGGTRGIGASPVMELAQTPLMAHALKEGTFNTDDWSEKGLGRFKDDIQDIYK